MAECEADCTIALNPGRYIVETDETDAVPSARRVVTLETATVITTQSGSRTQRRERS